MQPARIDRYIADDEGLRPIVAKAQDIRTLTRLCADFLPAGLARQLRVAHLSDGELSLLVTNAAAAAKLKMLAETLRKFLLRQGSKVSLISVRVQPSNAQSELRPARKEATLSSAGISELSALYGRLAPGSPARLALGLLLRRQRLRPPPAAVPRKTGAARGRAGKARS
ncbi:MAG TPA: DciA family protein [Burkholderiales bacterium]|nr:DciA family protein [Burkholderiales bacterium]